MMSRLLLAIFLIHSVASAATPAFTDVPEGSWFRPAVLELAMDGHIDRSKTTFRPAAPATRAEFLKLAMGIDEKTPGIPPLLPSFNDVPKTAWHFALMEEAAKEAWIRGDGNCYGSHPCRAHPEQAITRAEAAALLVRIFELERTTNTHYTFIDVGENDWFTYAIRAMADRCMLRGDAETLRIRPHDGMNRAEMAALFQRTRFVLKGKNACS